jgi:CubicO group peptidase (beta-lactamase class C family)
MRKEIEARIRTAIGEKVFPGCVVGIVRAGGKREIIPLGNFTYEPDSPKVTDDTVYDMASVTKSIPVASLALVFIAEGKLSLTEQVTKYLPEFHHGHRATIEDLLRYRVQGTRLSRLQHSTFEEIRTHVVERGFSGPPAEHQYTNLPAFVLGLVLERVGGAMLPALAHQYFFESLAMNDTAFFPHDIVRISPTEIISGEEIRGIVHDESARVFSRARRAAGHAGLFSSAPDTLNFLEALLQNKLPAVLDGAQKGLGWQKAEPWFMGTHPGDNAFGKTGFTGTSVAVDADKGIGFVILSNRTYPTRPPDAASLTSAINRFRADIADILLR